MKNRVSIKLCQKNLLTDKKYVELGKYSSILRAGEPRCLLARLRSLRGQQYVYMS